MTLQVGDIVAIPIRRRYASDARTHREVRFLEGAIAVAEQNAQYGRTGGVRDSQVQLAVMVEVCRDHVNGGGTVTVPVGVPNPPSPVPGTIQIFLLLGSAETMSRFPSPLKSPTAMAPLELPTLIC